MTPGEIGQDVPVVNRHRLIVDADGVVAVEPIPRAAKLTEKEDTLPDEKGARPSAADVTQNVIPNGKNRFIGQHFHFGGGTFTAEGVTRRRELLGAGRGNGGRRVRIGQALLITKEETLRLPFTLRLHEVEVVVVAPIEVAVAVQSGLLVGPALLHGKDAAEEGGRVGPLRGDQLHFSSGDTPQKRMGPLEENRLDLTLQRLQPARGARVALLAEIAVHRALEELRKGLHLIVFNHHETFILVHRHRLATDLVLLPQHHVAHLLHGLFYFQGCHIVRVELSLVDAVILIVAAGAATAAAVLALVLGGLSGDCTALLRITGAGAGQGVGAVAVVDDHLAVPLSVGPQWGWDGRTMP
ncbi:hypothetical protein AGDE_16765 [Angomonas deanei]|uniref:Uncharacterized protein n=1 Tax=Angomonas deanei TaxID=59799 RepID=A0A7G2CDB2_9TRYP|nr:hypothetical protein AGDE_16765 [Angomonas deanei]CAD2216834.1 hypothetical protein, conserved [Angomonas deanei]|eukprot:EPY16251.1 hypothetical protein AGDE_16765 [Angomonas deanei]